MDSKIIHVINEAAADVFESPGIQLRLSDSPLNIKQWDSLTQILLIAEIEKRFEIRFTFKELAFIRTIEDIVNITQAKIKAKLGHET